LQSSLSASGIDPSQLLGSVGSLAPGGQNTAKDTKRKTDLAALQTQLEAFFSQQGYYPSLADMNNGGWLSQNMPSLDQSAIQDPDGSSKTLAGKPAAHVYAYQPTTNSGGSCESSDKQCAKYTLTATLSDGTTFAKKSLD
jgi:type II secretory pathway pseudopilin PulG